MNDLSTVLSLYQLLLFTAMILLVILLYNNLVLYRRKLNDFLSLMLIANTIIGAFELLWGFCDHKQGLKALSYIGAGGYAVSFLAFSTFFNRFFLKQFGLSIQKK